MKLIEMNEAETAIWKEVGTRGAAFRRATGDRAEELARESGGFVEIVDENGAMIDNTLAVEPAPVVEPVPVIS